MNKFMMDALHQLRRHEQRGRNTPFWWCDASMKKLTALGYVEPWHPQGKVQKCMAHRLTDAGRRFMAGFPT